MQIFEVILFFNLGTRQQKRVKPTYLCPLDARKLADGKGHVPFFQNAGSQLCFRFFDEMNMKNIARCPENQLKDLTRSFARITLRVQLIPWFRTCPLPSLSSLADQI